MKFPVDRPIWQLSVGEQQRVEIVKTLYRGADIIILDEPTSVLTPGEAEQLFETLQVMKQAGKTVILTTHKNEGGHGLLGPDLRDAQGENDCFADDGRDG
ncbi:ATP-binding cassette domain-containing protein [Paenibacillus rhizoplanae]